MPLISFIMPARDAEAFLPAALARLSAQSDGDFEVIVVDDASSDATGAIARAAAAADPRIRVIAGHGLGPGVARNRALAAARGEILAFVDADDLIHPDYVATLRRFWHGLDEADVLVLPYVRGTREPVWDTPDTDGRSLFLRPLDFALAPKASWRMTCRRTFFAATVGHFLTTYNYEDVVPALLLLMHAQQLVQAGDVPLYFYRERPGSLVQRCGRERVADACRTLTEIATIHDACGPGRQRQICRLAQIWLLVGIRRLLTRAERRRLLPALLAAGGLTLRETAIAAIEMAWRGRGKRLRSTLGLILDLRHLQTRTNGDIIAYEWRLPGFRDQP